MKKLAILFSALLITFMSVWVYKAKTPINRPDDEAVQLSNPWWESNTTPQADPEWILDPEIPANYIPVPGEDELYMVIDEDGMITGYRYREQQEDGSWVWSDVNPDIPENYDPVPGLENVYKVINEDGSVSYFRYIRNEDDTFAFVPCDKDGKDLPEKPDDQTSDSSHDDNSKIPDNYVHVSGNVYAVYNEFGVCIGYKERRYDSETGKYYWVDTTKPTEESSPGISLWVDIPTPTIDYNPVQSNTGGGTTMYYPSTGGNTGGGTIYIPPSSGSQASGMSTGGNYTETETITEKKTSGGWLITYETVVTRVYDSTGTLVSTSKNGPNEVSREKVTGDVSGVPDPSMIASSLSGEYARVSTGLSFNSSIANEVLALINTERAAAGLPSLSLSSGSTPQMLASTKAADMAIYGHSDYDSPMYGTMSQMCTRFGISYGSMTEYVWRCSSGNSAAEIASRLQLMGSSDFSSASYSSIGLAIVSKGGYYYVDVVLMG